MILRGLVEDRPDYPNPVRPEGIHKRLLAGHLCVERRGELVHVVVHPVDLSIGRRDDLLRAPIRLKHAGSEPRVHRTPEPDFPERAVQEILLEKILEPLERLERRARRLFHLLRCSGHLRGFPREIVL